MGAGREYRGRRRLADGSFVFADAFVQPLPTRAIRVTLDGTHGADVCHDGHRARHRDLPGLGTVCFALDRIMVQRQSRERARIRLEFGTRSA